MDTAKPLGMITGSLVRPTLPPNCEPNENERKLAELLKLGSHYWTPDFTPAQAKHLLADYIEDLEAVTLAEVEIACRNWRRGVANKKFPRVAELLDGVQAYRRERAQEAQRRPQTASEYSDGMGRPLMWWYSSRALWKLHWRESDIPAHARPGYDAWKAKVTNEQG